jgi:Spy/CpxP family protein refolding chaperone
MKPQNIVIALVLIAGVASLSAAAQWPLAPVQQMAPAEIDFTALHQQASDALDNLRRSQQRRASDSPVVF